MVADKYKMLVIQVTPEEKEEFRKVCRKKGFAVSRYLRNFLLEEIGRDPEDPKRKPTEKKVPKSNGNGVSREKRKKKVVKREPQPPKFEAPAEVIHKVGNVTLYDVKEEMWQYVKLGEVFTAPKSEMRALLLNGKIERSDVIGKVIYE